MDRPRILGIDHGTVRCGLAVSDALGWMAHPLETVPAEQAPARIAELVRQLPAAAVVLGLPLRLDGSEGPAAERVRRFAERLRPLLPSETRLILRDESLTTVEAHSRLRAAGRRTHRHRPVIDQASAVLILQEYLDELNPPPPAEPDGAE